MSGTQEFSLANPPTDGITAVRFAPKGTDYLLVSSWDSSVRLYDLARNTFRMKYNHKAAVLDCCFSDAVHSFSGGLDCELKMYDINSQTETLLGEHEKPIRCVEYSDQENLLVTGSWDHTVKFWDVRSKQCVGTHTQPSKVFTLALSFQRLIVGTANRNIWIWDMRRMSEPQQRRESSLKYQTRCIRAFPEGDGFALSSTEGRVAMEYFDPAPQIQAKKYAFKCHRVKGEDGVEQVYPANVIAFHPEYGTFATGGCDGIVNTWDGKNKKRLCQFKKYPTSISALDFSKDGSQLAIASSYTFYDGDKGHNPDQEQIFIRNINDVEVHPKARPTK